MNDNISVELWKPVETIPNEILDVNSINFSGNTLTLSLCDDNDDYIFVFDELITNCGSYKYTSAVQNLKLNDEIGYWYKQCGINEKTYPLLILHSSNYLKKMNSQFNYEFTSYYKELKHYVFITYDAVVEVISTKEPRCNVVKGKR